MVYRNECTVLLNNSAGKKQLKRKRGKFLSEKMHRRNVGACWESGKEVRPSGVLETLTVRDILDIYRFFVESASPCSTQAGGSLASADIQRTYI